MRLEPQKKVQPPKKWLYVPLLKLISFTFRHFLKMRVENEETKNITGPAVMVAAHEGMLDFIFTGAAFPNRQINYVGSEHYFRIKLLKPILNLFGVISKLQFYPDINAIKNMMRVTKQGGIVGIFPAGQTSMCGVPSGIEQGIARLVKKLGVPVVAVIAHGSFFTKSRFAGQFARGECHVKTRLILSAEQLSQMTESEIYSAITAGIYYDEYEWQKSSRVKFRGKNRAGGYEFVTYKCPKCEQECTMQGDGNRLYCASCGNAATLDDNMHFVPENENCKIFPTLRDWYNWQLESVREAVSHEDFSMETPVTLFALSEKSRFVERGHGTMCLTRDTISYSGTYCGRQYTHEMKNSTLPGLMGETGRYFEIYNPEEGPFRFYPADGHLVAKWKQTQEYIYSQSVQTEIKI